MDMDRVRIADVITTEYSDFLSFLFRVWEDIYFRINEC